MKSEYGLSDSQNQNLYQTEKAGNQKVKKIKKRPFQFSQKMGVLGNFVEVIPGEFEVDKVDMIRTAVDKGIKAAKLG